VTGMVNLRETKTSWWLE